MAFGWFVNTAHAYTINVPFPGKSAEYTKFSDYIIDLIGFATTVATALAVLVILVGAFKYATSAGDQTKTKDAKDIIIGAVVGLAMLFLLRLLMGILKVQ